MKKLIAILCSITLCIGSAGPAFAAAETINTLDQGIYYVSETFVNPRYPVADGEKSARDENAGFRYRTSKRLFALPNANTYAGSVEEAGSVLRQQMTERETMAVVPIRVKNASASRLELLMDQIFEEACRHTGRSNEGDALMWAWKTWSCDVSGCMYGGEYYLEFCYNLEFYTTPQQETVLLDAISDLKGQLQIDGAENTEKIKTIYDYLCENVDYDYENLDDETYDLKYTDYAALVNKTSVCQGYALLFYRLALEYDIDARVIAGIGGGGPHAWNIVQVGDLYYCLDATWDAEADPDAYYLLGSRTFSQDHAPDNEYLPEALAGVHPISETDFEGTVHSHELETVTLLDATCDQKGMQQISCNSCVYTVKEETAMLPHTPGADATCTTPQLCSVCSEPLQPAKGHNEEILPAKAATCTETGLTTGRKCKDCGTVIVAQVTVPEAGHRYGNGYICTTCGYVNEALKPAPEPTPEVKPETAPTPEVTPSPEATPSPGVTPVVKPDATPTPEVKPAPVPERAEIGEVLLSASRYVYNGKAKTPKVIVKDTDGKVLQKGADYTVKTPAGRKKVGKYTYTVQFKGDYAATKAKKLVLTIQPAKPVIKVPKAAKKAVTVKWKKVAKETSGYQVMAATNKTFTKNVKKAFVKKSKTVSKKMTGLKAKTKYYVKVRSYKTVKGVKIYSDWSKVKTVRTK